MKIPDHYTRHLLKVDIYRANLVGILILVPVALLYGIPYYLIWKADFTIENLKYISDGMGLSPVLQAVIVFGTIIIGVILHEAIHGLTWARYASNGHRAIRYGFMLKMLTPYCHCTEPLQVRHYITGALMPAIVLGLLPALISIITGQFFLLVLGIFFTMVATGDFMVANLLRREKMDDYAQDHPSEAGCYVFRKP